MNHSITGKVALITGASSGIGRAMARTLADAGAKVALTARSADKLADIAAEIGPAAKSFPADLGTPSEVARLVAGATAHFGKIDILLANAGLYIPGDVSKGDPDDWDTLLNININATFRLVHAVLPQMIARKSGDILLTSSISGHQAIHWEPVYSASKHAVQSFTHGLRRQVAPQGLRVGAIAPGMVANELWGFTDPAKIAAKIQAHEAILSVDVAEAALFMLTRPAHVTIRDLVILPQNQDL